MVLNNYSDMTFSAILLDAFLGKNVFSTGFSAFTHYARQWTARSPQIGRPKTFITVFFGA